MSRQKVMHYVEHHCGEQECDCEPLCKVAADECQTISLLRYVTCGNCLRMIEAAQKRKWKREAAQIRAHEARANEAGGGAWF